VDSICSVFSSATVLRCGDLHRSYPCGERMVLRMVLDRRQRASQCKPVSTRHFRWTLLARRLLARLRRVTFARMFRPWLSHTSGRELFLYYQHHQLNRGLRPGLEHRTGAQTLAARTLVHSAFIGAFPSFHSEEAVARSRSHLGSSVCSTSTLPSMPSTDVAPQKIDVDALKGFGYEETAFTTAAG